jgi:flagellar hook-associated protein 2
LTAEKDDFYRGRPISLLSREPVMGRIQTNVGWTTGINISDTVNQLMKLSAKPRDMLNSRTDTIRQELVAITGLAGLLYAVKSTATTLGKTDLYHQRTSVSSDLNALTSNLSGNAALGTYEFTPLRLVQSQKQVSSGFKADNQPIGAGEITIRFGDHVERDTSLGLLNGGQGIARGKIRIVDRSGAFADIDLSTARTVDDVLTAINNSSSVNVSATVRDGHFRIVDNTGLAAANLKVVEVGGGTTAASLGLGGIDVAAATANGQDVFRLYGGMDLTTLNDGAGVSVNKSLADIRYTLRDGTVGQIDLSPSGGTADTTLDAVLARINAAAPTKLRAEMSPDGTRLQLTDLTVGAESFALESLFDSQALKGLGLDTAATDDVLTGRRIIGGLKTVLLSSLDGGRGMGELGTIEITDRNGGAPATVDLAGLESLEEVVDAINTSGVGVQARVNRARNGIEIVDTSGGAGALVIANGDATETASKLNIAVNSSVASIDSGDMHLQVVSESTLLSSLNGGAGVAAGQFVIRDSQGRSGTVDLRSSKTVGDAIAAINRLFLSARAELNETGDGIVLRDTGGGASTLTVVEGSTTTARDLGLLRTAKTVDVEGESQQIVNGSLTHRIEISATDTLNDLKNKINALAGGFSVSVLNDGSTQPYRLMMQSGRAGKAGELTIDTSAANFRFDESAKAQDALLALGPASNTATAILLSSSSNTFRNVVEGLTVDMKQATGTTVSVNVSSTNTNLVAAAKTLVENYNLFRKQLVELAKYDTTLSQASLLTGNATALRLDVDMTQLLRGEFTGTGEFRSLSAIGFGFGQDGTITLDETAFKAAIAANPDAIEQFLSAPTTGVSARLSGMIERLAGEDSSLVTQRLDALEKKIASNELRMERMDALLEKQRERLTMSFYNMELAVTRIQGNLKYLDSIAWITENNQNSK